MKKIFLIFVCMVAVISAQAQNDNSGTVTRETATQFSNDQALIDLYNQLYGKQQKVKVKPVHDAQYYKKKVARLRKSAYILGGAMVASGIVMCAIGDKEPRYTRKYTKYYDENYNVVGFDFDIIRTQERCFGAITGTGVGLIGGGLLIGIPCIARANHLSKFSKQYVSSAALWENEFNFKNGSSLDLGFDAISDQTRTNTTVGLGVRYNF